MIPSLLNIKLTFITILSLSWLMMVSSKFVSNGLFPSSEIIQRLSEPLDHFQDDQVYDVADKMPRPVGGQDGWEAYLAENINYPKAALHSKTEGVVYMIFILEKDGRSSNVQVMRGIGAGCDEEAKRLVVESPKWIPGENNGESVRVRMRISVRFHLPN